MNRYSRWTVMPYKSTIKVTPNFSYSMMDSVSADPGLVADSVTSARQITTVILAGNVCVSTVMINMSIHES